MIVNLKSALITSIGIVSLFAVITNLSHAQSAHSQILFVNATLQDSSETNDKKYVMENEGCSVPHITHDPTWDVFQYSAKLNPCLQNQHPLIKKNKTHIWISNRNSSYNRALDNPNFKCCYTILKLHSIKKRDKSSGLRNCIYFKNTILAKNEFIRITCSYKTSVIYDEKFVFAVKKPFTRQRPNPFPSLSNQSAYNVVILGLSSISRLKFHRTMKDTSNFAKNQGAIELFGYNKVADNTYQNVIPAIVGMSAEQLSRTCWPNTLATLDHCPYIWERFKDSGYYTVLAEDTTEDGIFKTNHSHFSANPTDYYFHPFTNKTNLNRNQQQSDCMGDEYYYLVALNYIRDLMSILSPSKLFALFWESSISRKKNNFPNSLDTDYTRFLQNLNSRGFLNETFIFVLSDRGMKHGDIRLTNRHGKSEERLRRLEERLPVASILVPPSFGEKYPLAYENLKTNSRRLSTAYDVHETLIDLINLSAISNEELIERTRTHYTKKKGISLFLPIPGNRTCRSAGIKKQWCACTDYKTKTRLVPRIYKKMNKVVTPKKLKMKRRMRNISTENFVSVNHT